MKEVFIKYNPYCLETEIEVEGRNLCQNSKIKERSLKGTRLQEWIEDFPQLLVDEYNDNQFRITFHGTLLDYEDLKESFDNVIEYSLNVSYIFIPAKETADKGLLIDGVFKKIQAGPFDELRDEALLNAFKLAKSDDFEICVVATMSAGKSTMINALIRDKLMPSRQEACTAIITRIKDNDCGVRWEADVYNRENCVVETCNDLTYSSMEKLNSDGQISSINVRGDIPFVSADELSLVLIDTPGPNNARDPKHRKVQNEFLNKSSKSLVIYIMESTFGSDDDNALLHHVADSMKVGGKQSKDRFIFVVNKMDERRREDGDVESTLERVRSYLRYQGIDNPNLFPAAALPALNIRLITKGKEVDEDTRDETEMMVRKLNRNENLHLEQYSSLPRSACEKINNMLREAENCGDEKMKALVHTGVLSIEVAIEQYVKKYAKTAKIKNIVDTFNHKLDELGCVEKIKQELLENQENSEKIANQISIIRKKIDDGNAAKYFNYEIEDAVDKNRIESEKLIENIICRYQSNLTQAIKEDLSCKKMSEEDADRFIKKMKKYVRRLELDLQSDLDIQIRDNLMKTCDELLDKYKRKLASLTDEMDFAELKGFTIDPIMLMAGSLSNLTSISIEKMLKTERCEQGKKWIKNENKKWYKPWTWFDEDGHYEKVYVERDFVYSEDLLQKFFPPIEESLRANGESAKMQVIEDNDLIANLYIREVERLDNILVSKMKEFEDCVKEKVNVDKRIKATEMKLEWLEEIQSEVASILEI